MGGPWKIANSLQKHPWLIGIEPKYKRCRICKTVVIIIKKDLQTRHIKRLGDPLELTPLIQCSVEKATPCRPKGIPKFQSGGDFRRAINLRVHQ
jgi:hypothetical protein